MAYDQITLSNGLRVIGEYIPHVRSVSVGLWVGCGSQYEAPCEGGLSHFIEHMAFKGTRSRTARQIAFQMDAVGGQINAFTSKESTCYYVKVIDEQLPLALDILCELAFFPTFDPVELEKEKGVILEEIDMAEDTPEDLVHELLLTAQYGKQKLALPILGTHEQIRAYTRDELCAFHTAMYHPANCVLSLAGKYDWEKVVAMAEKLTVDVPGAAFVPRTLDPVTSAPSTLARTKDIEQVHLALGFPGLPISTDPGYEELLYNSVYGGAMSSRLFQRVREGSGLAYSIYSYPLSYFGAGMLAVYAATNPENAGAVLDMILEETRTLVAEGITKDEFIMARDQLKATYMLGLESTSTLMQANGRRLLTLNITRTADEAISRFSNLEINAVNDLMRRSLSAEYSLAIVGNEAEAFAKTLK